MPVRHLRLSSATILLPPQPGWKWGGVGSHLSFYRGNTLKLPPHRGLGRNAPTTPTGSTKKEKKGTYMVCLSTGTILRDRQQKTPPQGTFLGIL